MNSAGHGKQQHGGAQSQKESAQGKKMTVTNPVPVIAGQEEGTHSALTWACQHCCRMAVSFFDLTTKHSLHFELQKCDSASIIELHAQAGTTVISCSAVKQECSNRSSATTAEILTRVGMDDKKGKHDSRCTMSLTIAALMCTFEL